MGLIKKFAKEYRNKKGYPPDLQSNEPFYLLVTCTEAGNLEYVDYLLTRYAPEILKYRDEKTGEAYRIDPFSQAAVKNDNFEMIKLYLKHGASIKDNIFPWVLTGKGTQFGYGLNKRTRDFLNNELKKELENESKFVNEGFTEESDPVKDMGIGINTIIYNVKPDGEGGYNFHINNEKLLKVIREEFKYQITKNEIDRFVAFDMEDIYQEIPMYYFEKNDLEEIDKYIISKIKYDAHHWLGMHGDEAMRRMHSRH